MADKPEHARVLRNLSKQWVKLADEKAREAPKSGRTICR
jgi:hypothetical protein